MTRLLCCIQKLRPNKTKYVLSKQSQMCSSGSTSRFPGQYINSPRGATAPLSVLDDVAKMQSLVYG